MNFIYINGNKFSINTSSNLLETCLSLDFDVPYFCWHPMLGSIGACRLCAVKVFNQNQNKNNGKIIMSCMTPSTPNLIISTIDNELLNFRKNIIEMLMINHPHDCPVCEEGGSCHLQDMTVMTKHYSRRYRFSKRTYNNQYLGPFISHEMNRCITCYRCVRFYKDYAGGTDFGVYGVHNNIYFGRLNDGILLNEFSGNLIEICPTGVFTDKTNSKHYIRKWDMQFSPSICHQCSIGCNISPGERNGKIRKIENRYNNNINHYFICDRGRFGYGYLNNSDRPKQPMMSENNRWININSDEAIRKISKYLNKSTKTIGIGSPRASIESNFSLRELVGETNFFSGISKTEQDKLMLILTILRNGGIYSPSLREIENYDTILVLGEDITQTGPRVALSVRQAVKNKAKQIAMSKKIENWQSIAILNSSQNEKCPLFITSVDYTNLDDIATLNYYAGIEEQAIFGFSIANNIDNTAPLVEKLNPYLQAQANLIAKSLVNARQPLIITGSNTGSESIIAAAANISLALKKRGSNVGISFILSEVNSLGIGMIGGKNLDDALNLIENNNITNLIVLENDLYRHAFSTRLDFILSKIKNLIVIDHQLTKTCKKANLILPAATFSESIGTVINNEGRAQRFFKVYNPSYYNKKLQIFESWRWLYSLNLKKSLNEIKFDLIFNMLEQKLPYLAGIKKAAPNSSFRINGQKLSREPNPYSGRTAQHANLDIHEPCIPKDNDSMFTFSMEGNNSPYAPRNNIPFVWYPGWNSVQSLNKFQKNIGGPLRFGDPGIRLFEINKQDDTNLDWLKYIPPIYDTTNKKYWIIAPYWHIFGSDETSQKSEVIKEVMPRPYVVINYDDSLKLNIKNGTYINLSCLGQKLCLPVIVSNILPSGQIGLPMGFPDIPPILAGLIVEKIKKVKELC